MMIGQKKNGSLESGPKLYVGGLNESIQKDELQVEFQKFGELRDVWVARNPPGFAFVEFVKRPDAEKAVRALDGMNVCGSRIRVEFSHTVNKGIATNGSRSSDASGTNRNRSSGNSDKSRRSPNFNRRDITSYNGGRPRTPPLPAPRINRGPLTPPRREFSPHFGADGVRYSSRSLRRSPLSSAQFSQRYPHDIHNNFAPVDSSGPMLPFPGYPMVPFPFPEEFLRNLARSRSPYSAAAAAAAAVASGIIPPIARGRSPFGSLNTGHRARSRSRCRDRNPLARRIDREEHYFAPAPRNDNRSSCISPLRRRNNSPVTSRLGVRPPRSPMQRRVQRSRK